MYNLIALHFDPHTLKGIAIGFGIFLLLLLMLIGILKPFFRREQRYFGHRRPNSGSGFLMSFVIAICLIVWVNFNSTAAVENNPIKAQEEIVQEKSVTDDDYRNNGSDIFFEGEQKYKEEKETVMEKTIPPPSLKKELEERTIRVNQRPSHSNMRQSPKIQRVETSALNTERSFTLKSKIYYIQLSAARTLDDGQNSVAYHATAHPKRVFLTKVIDDESGFPFKILMGPFPTKLNARNAVRGKRGIVRSELDEDLIFIDY